MIDHILAWDEFVFLRINGLSGSWLDYLLAWPTFLGQVTFLLPLMLLLMRIWDKAWLKNFLRVSISLVAVNMFSRLLKELFHRPRPYTYFAQAMAEGKIHVNYIFDTGVSYSFPSGHAATAFACVVILNILYSGKLLFLYPLAFLIAFSRVYTGVHFPTDVIAGAVLGILMGQAFGWMMKLSSTAVKRK